MKIIELFTFMLLKSLTNVEACVDMKNTVVTVPECPRTAEAWNARALLKRCTSVCSTSQYHCVINKEMTAYIEVCATPRYMQGYCAYFDPADDKIKGMYQLDCSMYPTPCPTRYHSIEAYKYPSCYDAVKQYVTIAPTVDRNTTLNTLTVISNSTDGSQHTMDEEESTPVVVIAVLVVLVLVMVAVILGIMIIWRKRRQKHQSSREDNEITDSAKERLMPDTNEVGKQATSIADTNEVGKQATSIEIKEMNEEDNSSKLNALIASLKEEYEVKFAQMFKEMELLKAQKETDNQELRRKVLEINKECKQLNNKLQEAKGNIRVLCRIRHCEENDILSTTRNTVTIKGIEKKYAFERVFGRSSAQVDVYDDIQELIKSFLDGYNLCIFAYGQTGSGKTYTMEGLFDITSNEREGIIPRAMKQVFKDIEELKVTGWTYELRASYIELYNEEIRDLSNDSKDQGKHEIKYQDGEQGKATISNITEKVVQSSKDALEFYKRSSKNRTSAKTGRNETSSRSHAIFRLEMTGKVENVEGIHDTCSGTLTLVDLAGSERLDNMASATTNQETKKINLSLMELSKVLRALRRKEPPVYRNSKLTYLLKNSLGGNSKTLMIVNVSPAEDCKKETERTLEFGREVSKVVLDNVPRKNK